MEEDYIKICETPNKSSVGMYIMMNESLSLCIFCIFLCIWLFVLCIFWWFVYIYQFYFLYFRLLIFSFIFTNPHHENVLVYENVFGWITDSDLLTERRKTINGWNRQQFSKRSLSWRSIIGWMNEYANQKTWYNSTEKVLCWYSSAEKSFCKNTYTDNSLPQHCQLLWQWVR